MESARRTSKTQIATEHSRVRCIARSVNLCRCRQYHQERSAVSDSRSSRKPHRRVAAAKVGRTDQASARIQLRFLSLEESLRPEETLAGARKEDLSALRHPAAVSSASRTKSAAELFLQAVPGAVSLKVCPSQAHNLERQLT